MGLRPLDNKAHTRLFRIMQLGCRCQNLYDV